MTHTNFSPGGEKTDKLVHYRRSSRGRQHPIWTVTDAAIVTAAGGKRFFLYFYVSWTWTYRSLKWLQVSSFPSFVLINDIFSFLLYDPRKTTQLYHRNDPTGFPFILDSHFIFTPHQTLITITYRQKGRKKLSRKVVCRKEERGGAEIDKTSTMKLRQFQEFVNKSKRQFFGTFSSPLSPSSSTEMETCKRKMSSKSQPVSTCLPFPSPYPISNVDNHGNNHWSWRVDVVYRGEEIVLSLSFLSTRICCC